MFRPFQQKKKKTNVSSEYAQNSSGRNLNKI